MNMKDFPNLSTSTAQDPPHRAMSRAPARHNLRVMFLGCIATAAVFAVLWTLY